MALRECVRRFSRLPQILVVDGGREFESTYFETLLARYECTKKTRPPAKARFGSVCERLFGTANTQFIHNLRGNTQITRNVRQVTKSVNPKTLATWRLAELHQRLSQYFYEVHDTLKQPTLGQNFNGPIHRNAHDAFRRVHPGVTVQQFVLLGADGFEVGNGCLLQLRFREQLGGLHGISDAGLFARLEVLQQSEQQADGDDAHDDQTYGELTDRPYVDVGGFMPDPGIAAVTDVSNAKSASSSNGGYATSVDPNAILQSALK